MVNTHVRCYTGLHGPQKELGGPAPWGPKAQLFFYPRGRAVHTVLGDTPVACDIRARPLAKLQPRQVIPYE